MTIVVVGAVASIDGALAQSAGRAKAAAPTSIDDCERVKEAMAYNACLAKFGPARAGHGPKVTSEISGNGDGKSGDSAASAATHKRDRSYRRSGKRNTSGRASASFTLPSSIIDEGYRRKRR